SRLDVTMNNPFLVRMMDGPANLHEKMQALAGIQPLFIAIPRYRDAFDQFHDEKRAAGCRRTAIEDLGDVWMFHQCQRLPLRFEARKDVLGIHPEFDDFDGHQPADGLFLFGHVNDPAAAFANFLKKFVVANALAWSLA